MNLIDKLVSIRLPSVTKLPDNSQSSLKDLWDNLIAMHLPNVIVAKEWHRRLMDYVNDEDAVFCIRAFGSENGHDRSLDPVYGGIRYNSLRRGFLTQVKCVDGRSFSYIFVDNFFTSYFTKMAEDGFVPSYLELMDSFKSRQFPHGFMVTGKQYQEKELQAFHHGKNPGFSNNGYKISHVIPTGTGYYYGGREHGIAEICNAFFPRGFRDDWDPSTRVRTYDGLSSDDFDTARRIAVACFLRTVHPFNHFLTPKQKCQNAVVKSGSIKDIGEYKGLTDYAYGIFRGLYGKEYDEFLKLIMVDITKLAVGQDEQIDIKYSLKLKSSSLTPPAAKKNSLSQNPGSPNSGKNLDRYSIGGRGAYVKAHLPAELAKTLLKIDPELSLDDIKTKLGLSSTQIVSSTNGKPRFEEVKAGCIYVHTGCWSPRSIGRVIQAANETGIPEIEVTTVNP